MYEPVRKYERIDNDDGLPLWENLNVQGMSCDEILECDVEQGEVGHKNMIPEILEHHCGCSKVPHGTRKTCHYDSTFK